jgi:hypothetical protein
MEKQDPSQLSPVDTAEGQPDLGTATTPPRENPEVDQEDLERAEEKLDKIAGN